MLMLKIIMLAFCLAVPASVFAAELPAFFESIKYENFFPGGRKGWEPDGKTTGENLTVVKWKNGEQHELTLTFREATSSTVQTMFSEMGKGLDDFLQNPGGQILSLSEYFAIVAINDSEKWHSLQLLYGTPDSVCLWKYQFPKDYKFNTEDYIKKVSLAAREHQYTTALKEGNVTMGRWGTPVHEYAKLLVQVGDPEAETVYHHLLRTSPSNYDAHVEFISLTKEKEKKIESARIVRRGAEEEKLLDAAAKVLNEGVPSLDSYQVISRNDKGLKVILIPLKPCNPWILKEIAETYKAITTVPVVIRRLPETWKLPPPSRSVYRRYLEKIALRIWPTKKDFTDWSLSKLQEELMTQARQDGPQAVQSLRELFKKIEGEGGQWDADPLMHWLSRAVLPYWSKDPNTMIVGLTEIDIYSGDTNFVFSVYGGLPESPVSLLSYARMRGQFNGEGQSRKRLVERAAKELVPASLKKLEIPRSTDPTCPYSYASGLQRLDEKTLILSDSVKKAIERIRAKNGPNGKKQMLMKAF